MQRFERFIVLGALTLLTGCVSPGNVTMLKPIGPAPLQEPQHAAQGLLCVYSAREPRLIDLPMEEWLWNNDLGKNEFLNAPALTDYKIYGQSHQVVQQVRNADGPNRSSPARVALSPGHYEILAQAEHRAGQEPLRVPLIILAGETTTVYLRDGWEPRHPYHDSQVVHLPDGQIAGWLAGQ